MPVEDSPLSTIVFPGPILFSVAPSTRTPLWMLSVISLPATELFVVPPPSATPWSLLPTTFAASGAVPPTVVPVALWSRMPSPSLPRSSGSEPACQPTVLPWTVLPVVVSKSTAKTAIPCPSLP